ncbi:MAG: hypothetical protein ABSF38_10495 [Verrucomicrobiota bacterium]|jgi:hypothetical protein
MKKSRISEKILLTIVPSSFPSFPSVQNRSVKSVVLPRTPQSGCPRATRFQAGLDCISLAAKNKKTKKA